MMTLQIQKNNLQQEYNISSNEDQYHNLLRYVLLNGVQKEDRTGTGTLSIFGYQMRFDLLKGFPLITTKKIHFKSVIYELLWFLSGDTNIKYLNDHGVTIWDEWADENGDLGPIYGKQWIHWENKDGKRINQIKEVIELLKTDPNSRRLIVSAWNVGDLQSLIRGKKTSPPPCHVLFQFYVANGKLSCQLYQRSADIFLGVPFNIASYALLTMMVAQVTGFELGEFVHTLGDAHLYLNHIEQAKLQLSREPKSFPIMELNPKVTSIFDFKFEDFKLIGYDPWPAIKAPIAI